MKNKKLFFTLYGSIVLTLLAGAFILKDITDPFIWSAWFTSFGAIIAIYNHENVKQKKIISENYQPQLDEKNKDFKCG